MKKIVTVEGLIYLIVFLLPAYLLKVKIFGLPTNALEILMAICIVAVILKLGFINFLRRIFRKEYVFSIGLIIAGLIISMVVNKNYLVGLGIIKGWFILPILFALAVRNILGKEKIQNIYAAYYFSAVAVAAVGTAYLFFGELTYDGRLQAFFNSPNYLAMYLAPAIIIAGAKFRISNFEFRIKAEFLNFKNILYFLSSCLILLIFYFTYSYAAWVAVVLSLIIVGIIKNKNSGTIKKAVIFGGIISVLILSQWNNQKFEDARIIAERSSLQSRIMIWKSSARIIEDNFVFGIGPGNFQKKYLEYQEYFPLYLEWAVPHPHNIFLAFWLYSGLVGLAGFIILIAAWFKSALKSESEFKYVALGIMLYILIHGFIDTTYFKNDLAAVFWMNIIMLL